MSQNFKFVNELSSYMISRNSVCNFSNDALSDVENESKF